MLPTSYNIPKMSRPQVGIERLPARRMSSEPRESMNCKSCRKRKIKCNRLRPTCEACQVFQCACIYDAIPKKRGPKTDVLEALLKRVDGLEKRLKEEKTDTTSSNADGVTNAEATSPSRTLLVTTTESAIYSPTPPSSEASPIVQPDVLIETYFSRVHGNVYHILDETSTRQRLQLSQIPNHLLYAIYAVSARYAAHPGGYAGAVRLSEEYAFRARNDMDIDDPSIDALQTLLLLSMAFSASGKGKKAYMMLASGVGMAVALELHRELDISARVTPVEREMRRRLFWTCYIMDRFNACGSKRPSLIADKSIVLRLPSWSPNPASLPIEGEFFQSVSNLQYYSGSGKKSQGSIGMLIDIVRILGITNRYLAAGGVKGDSHFPWHSLSNLSKIRQDLDIWTSGTQDVFSSVDALFGQSDSTTLVLSKLIYHLIHCLIYRPFLPIDLAELAGTGQHQSWQIEATNLCFLHANAIAELVELGKQSAAIEWPAFVGYCICTAGTVHVHGAHYKGSREGEVFSASADFLSREMQQLAELRYTWSSVQHQRETIQRLYSCHSELVKSLSSNPMRYSPAFHLEDFFDRYRSLGQLFDDAHVSLIDVSVDPSQDNHTGHSLYAPRPNAGSVSKTRRKSSAAARKKYDAKALSALTGHLENRLVTQHQEPLQSGAQPSPSPIQSDPMSSEHPNTNGNGNPFSTPLLQNIPFSPPPFYNTTNISGNSHESMNNVFGLPTAGTIPANTNTTSFTESFARALPADGSGAFGQAQQDHVMANGGDGTGSENGGEEKDPFLSLLEQLAENEHSRGGPSELDFFLGGGSA